MAKQLELASAVKGIPEEVIFDNVLPRLPPKPLGQFMLVSKSWCELIKSPAFIRDHLNHCISRYGNDPDFGYLIYTNFPPKMPGNSAELLSDGSSGYNKVLDLQVPAEFSWADFIVFDVCNGIVCLTEDSDGLYGRRIFLWNPCIRKFKVILDSTCDAALNRKFNWIALGCGYDFGRNEFKVVRIVYFCKDDNCENLMEQTQIEIYSLSTNSWKKIEEGKLNWIIHSVSGGVLVNGFVNWLAFYTRHVEEDLIVSFDLNKEKFRTFELPKNTSDKFVRGPLLMDYKGYLAFFGVVHKPGLDWSNEWSLWVQRKYGVASTWEKVLNVVTEERLFWSLGSTKKSDILLLTVDFRALVYDFKDQNVKNLGIPNFCPHRNYLATHIESLLLLNEKSEDSAEIYSLLGFANKEIELEEEETEDSEEKSNM